MDIKLYINKDPLIKVNKNIGDPIDTLTGTLKEKCDLEKPSILIESSTVPTANYAYIPEFNRYYNIVDVVSERAKLWRLEMEEDYYMSWKTGILKNTPILERCEKNNYDLYLPDNEMPLRNDTFTVTDFIGTDSFIGACILTVQS